MKKYFLILIPITIALFFYLRRPRPLLVHPQIGPITESIYAISTVKSEWNYSLRLGVISSVEKYYVKEGDIVHPGDKLLSIEGGTIFKAPHIGVVTDRPFGIKETIIPQSSIIKIVDMNQLYLEASIEQLAALKISKGMTALISFEDYRNKIYEGKVRTVLPRDQDFLLQIATPDLPKNILPGMSADVSIEIGTKPKAITIPSKAISNGYVLLSHDKKIQKVKVEVGISDSENSEILSPQLNPNDEIVIPISEKN